MTANSDQRRVLVRLTPAHMLFGSGAALLLSLYVVASGWFGWTGLFMSHPLLSIPCTLSLFVAPAFLYISLRQMTEAGVRGRLFLAALLSATAIGLVALGIALWLQQRTAA